MAIQQTRTKIGRERAKLKAYQSGKIQIVHTGREHIDATLSGLLPGDIVVIGGASGCVDDKTEYFNGTEWKSIANYQDGERVLQYNEDGSASLVTPYEYIKKEATDFYLLKSKTGVNQCVSEEHQVVYHSKSTKSLMKTSALDVVNRHKENKDGFQGFIPTSFNGYSHNLPILQIEENYLRLCIAIQADANYPKPIFIREGKYNGYMVRFRLKKEDKKKRLEDLLNKLGIDFVKKDISHQKAAKGFHNYIFYFPEYIKEFPKEWYSLNKACFKIIFDEVQNWDSSNEVGNRMFSYFSNSKNNADFIQFVCTSLNYRTSLKEDNHRENTNYVVRPTSRNLCTISRYEDGITPYTNHNGYKYCFRVPSGMLILRREGTINITGNSGKTFELQAIRENVMNPEVNKDAHHYAFLDYSFEMKLFNLILRGLHKALNKSKRKILLEEFSDYEKSLANRYIDTLLDDRFYIEENPLTPQEFLKSTREFLTTHRDKKSVIVAIDHMALFKNGKDGKKSTIDEVVEDINVLKKEFPNAIFILLTQLNRSILARIKDRDINAQPNRADVFQSDTMFHIADYLIIVHNPHRLGINQYLKVNPDHYPHLADFFCETEGISEKVSFETFGNIFFHVLKIREGEVVFKDIFIEKVQSENLEMYKTEKIDITKKEYDVSFDNLSFEDDGDEPF
jgi:replicative DNA helicase